MSLPRVPLQVLDTFERVAQSGSMQLAAIELNLSISTVSHHIARLEDELGVTLFDRTSRPFDLTQEGKQVALHLAKGLFHIRRATSETAISGLLGTQSLKIGIVEEFESTVTPELAAVLTKQMPRATLSIRNVLSHDASNLLRKGEIDLAVASAPNTLINGIVSEPLLSDPFVVARPHRAVIGDAENLFQEDDLAFLRFNPQHLIGKHIEAHLARNRIELPSRFVFDSVQSIMAIVANGAGWSIITPLGFMRAQRFAARVQLEPLALPAFARKIVLMTREDFDVDAGQALALLLRQIIEREVVAPACEAYPWLNGLLVTQDGTWK